MEEPKAYQFPHIAEISFDIRMSKVLQDGTIDTSLVSNKEMEKYGISNKAIFTVRGIDKIDCFKKIKQVLEALKYE